MPTLLSLHNMSLYIDDSLLLHSIQAFIKQCDAMATIYLTFMCFHTGPHNSVNEYF